MSRTRETARVFAALGDPTRRAVVERLSQGPATQTQLAARLPVSRQAIGKHLGALTAAGLVTRERRGREVLYRLTPGRLDAAVEWMASVGAGWDARLAALRRYLSR